jgi:hypothetical protein
MLPAIQATNTTIQVMKNFLFMTPPLFGSDWINLLLKPTREAATRWQWGHAY